jgi:hypothetical protein
MTRNQIAAINAAGEALRALDLGAVRLRYRPADDMITRDTFAVWIEPDNTAQIVGTGDTPEAALFDAMGQMEREAA